MTSGPNSRFCNWNFSDSPDIGVFATKRVMTGLDPMTDVFHEIAYVHLHCIIDKDDSLLSDGHFIAFFSQQPSK